MQHRSEDTQLEALSVALQHPAVAADQQNVCSIVQVCKAWRRSVQQSFACVTEASFKQVVAMDEIACITSQAADLARFFQWVSLYGGAIRSIQSEVFIPLAHGHSYSVLAQHIAALGLKAAAAAHQPQAVTNAVGTLHGSFAVDTTPLQPLRLQSFTCGKDLASSLVLSALPPATLTHLNIAVHSTVQIQEQLCRLSHLRCLQLLSRGGSLSSVLCSSISKLAELTSLSLNHLNGTDALQLLPGQLRQLTLHIDCDPGQSIDILQLHQLQGLRLCLYRPAAAVSLPQLQNLDIAAEGTLVTRSLLSSTLLQHLTLSNPGDQPQELLLLKQLAQLRTLGLEYDSMSYALNTLPVVSQLKQLAALRINLSGHDVDPQQIAALLSAVKALSSIRTLSLELSWEADDSDDEEAVDDALNHMGNVCQVVGHLTQLQELQLTLECDYRIKVNDLLHLSSLTALTSLQLDLGDNMNHTNLCAVLLQLTALQSLTVWRLGELYTLPVIGSLQGLIELNMHLLFKEQQLDSLKYLTGLRNLRQLGGFTDCSKDVMRDFWRKVHA